MKFMRNNIKNKSGALYYIMIAYIYIPYLFNVLENAFNISPLLNYTIYVILFLLGIVNIMYCRRNILIFLSIFSVILLMDILIVEYKYYVFIEGVQALIGISIPCICIVNNRFKLKKFINKWWKFSKINLPLVLIGVILLRKGLVKYSIFTNICVPNVFIGSYMLLSGIKNRKYLYMNITINILITIIFGGRMAALISMVMVLFAYLYSSKLWKKIIIIYTLIISTYIIITNLIEVLYFIRDILDSFGMKSRNITLIINQINCDEIYFTNRDYIYIKCTDYIKGRFLLPGIFGVPLYITDGEYYYSHNIILQLIITFGGIGTIMILYLIFKRMIKLKYLAPLECRKFLYFSMCSYIIIGMMGSSIWIHYLSTIFIAIFFFGNERLYYSIK